MGQEEREKTRRRGREEDKEKENKKTAESKRRTSHFGREKHLSAHHVQDAFEKKNITTTSVRRGCR